MTDECASGNAPDCSKVLAELEVFLDGELDELAATDLAQHLGDCPPCQDKADLESCVRDLLRSRCVEQAPADLRARVEARLAQWTA